nr:MAG TPA: hypothetical protein [Caudoviricetes sp.]DAV09599.1 MAG TPA: hypothetical protein [Caudoviricetes sp.]
MHYFPEGSLNQILVVQKQRMDVAILSCTEDC